MLCFLFTGKTFAQGELSSVSIFFPASFTEIPHAKYHVWIDGKWYTTISGEIYIDSIQPGMHKLEIHINRDDGKSRMAPRPFEAFNDSIYIPPGCEFIAAWQMLSIELRNKLCYTARGGCDVCFRKQEECKCGKYK
jgi:hypothetical protein